MALDYQPIFILGSGMLLQERKLAVVSNNLANANTDGFKKDFIEVSAWYTDMGEQIPSQHPENPTNNFVYPMITDITPILTQGPIRQTGNPLDVAIDGEGFFVVQTPEGIRFTRKGHFRLDSEGFLVTEEGYRVLDRENREIRLGSGNIEIDPQGNIYVNRNLTATLRVVLIENVEKAGEDFFTGDITGEAQNYRILQGHLEGSNVNPIEEMVKIIETARAHEVYSRLIQGLDEIQGRVNGIIR